MKPSISELSQASAQMIYQPLPRQSTRFLDLHPSEDPTAGIKCSLVVVELDGASCPQYEALSYAWGDPTVVHRITLDETPFEVATSISNALQQLRRPNDHSLLWVDAICINQTDLAEREEQLKMMKDIYLLAHTVRIWLGPEDDASREAMKLLRQVSKGYPKVQHEPGRHLGKYTVWESEYPDVETPINQICNVFARSWWSRIWCVQEITLANKAIFQLGDKSASEQEVLRCVSVLWTLYQRGALGEPLMGHMLYVMKALSNTDVIKAGRVIRQLDRDLDQYDAPTRLISTYVSKEKCQAMLWSNLASSLRFHDCSVVHDRVYGLYGLLPEHVFSRLASSISYSESARETYIRTTHVTMKFSDNLSMFAYIGTSNLDWNGREKSSLELPSWVPPFDAIPRANVHALFRIKAESLFAAAGGTQFTLRLLSNRVLCTRGFLLEIVFECLTVREDPADTLTDIYDKLGRFWNTSAAYKNRTIRGQDEATLETVFRRTMLWDCTDDGESDLDKSLMLALHRRTVSDTEVDDMFGKLHLFSSVGIHESEAARVKAKSLISERTFFTTSTGLTGIGAPSVQPGDYVFIVPGNSHPVILRPSKQYIDTYTAIGECYLEDNMDGNCLTELDLSGMEEHSEKLYGPFRDLPEDHPFKSGTERNPCSDEIREDAGQGWTWLLID